MAGVANDDMLPVGKKRQAFRGEQRPVAARRCQNQSAHVRRWDVILILSGSLIFWGSLVSYIFAAFPFWQQGRGEKTEAVVPRVCDEKTVIGKLDYA